MERREVKSASRLWRRPAGPVPGQSHDQQHERDLKGTEEDGVRRALPYGRRDNRECVDGAYRDSIQRLTRGRNASDGNTMTLGVATYTLVASKNAPGTS